MAREFCRNHDIDQELQEIITLHIEKSIYETKSKLLKKERSQVMSKEDDSENEVRLQNEIAQEPTPEPINDEDINAIQEEDHEQSSNHEEGDMEG